MMSSINNYLTTKSYKDIPTFFNELKNLYSYDGMQDMVLFNNKEILAGGRPSFIKEWFDSNILSIRDLLNSNLHLLLHLHYFELAKSIRISHQHLKHNHYN